MAGLSQHPRTSVTDQIFLAPGVPLDMVQVVGGTFWMGDEKLAHEVTVNDFWLGRYPVTNAQYLAFVEETGSHAPEWLEADSDYHFQTGTLDFYRRLGEALTDPRHPVVGVSWQGAEAFCAWLSAKTGHAYRLPSEAEWEYAARGGVQQQAFPYAGSHRLAEVGWYDENSHGCTKPVGLKAPNTLGLYDMSGNVWEWCADHWHDSYKGAPKDGSAWVTEGDADQRVVRGGSWLGNGDFCRVAFRFGDGSDYRDPYFGFRVARS